MPVHENSKKNLKLFQKGVASNPKGKAPGTKNRSTIARQVLEMVAKFPDSVWEKLKAQYPELQQNMTGEQMMAIVMMDKAIRKQDANAYKALMDSGYGLPKQEVDMTSKGESISLPHISFTKKEK